MTTLSDTWIPVCNASEIDLEDVLAVEYEARSFAIFHSPDDQYFATDGKCTHEAVNLADGLVMGNVIECPKHNGRFDYRTGQGKGAPICTDLRTYPVKVVDGKVFINPGQG